MENRFPIIRARQNIDIGISWYSQKNKIKVYVGIYEILPTFAALAVSKCLKLINFVINAIER